MKVYETNYAAGTAIEFRILLLKILHAADTNKLTTAKLANTENKTQSFSRKMKKISLGKSSVKTLDTPPNQKCYQIHR